MAPVRRSTRNSKSRTRSPKKQGNPQTGAKRRTNRRNKSAASKGEIVREKSPKLELNSSPIKQKNDQQTTPTKQVISKKGKNVLFSDDLVSDLPSTPERCSSPIRSILKPVEPNSLNRAADPNDTSLWDATNNARTINPKCFEFWLPGTIIQLPLGSEKLPMLVEGCMSVLDDEKFERRFEVYAALNGIVKTNPSAILLKLFASSKKNEIQQASLPLVVQVLKDISIIEKSIFNPELDKENDSPTKGDPFKVRVVTQALKLLNFVLCDTELNSFVTNADICWIYDHACTALVNPRISKALVSPYLNIIKDCKLNSSCKRDLFSHQHILEKLLFAVLNVKGFPSVSLVTERLICLKNYVLNFPDFMAKNIDHWFEPLLLNLCNMIHPLNVKCLGVGVHCLLEAAKCFLDCTPVHTCVLNKMSSRIALSVQSFTSSQEFSECMNQLRMQNVKLGQFVVSKLQELIRAEQHKLAMDMWMALTLLSSVDAFDESTYLESWLKVPNFCFSLGPPATAIALSYWRAVCFNLCKNNLDAFRTCIDRVQRPICKGDNPLYATHTLKSKTTVMMHVFDSFPLLELPKIVIDSLDNVFLGYLYIFLSPTILKLWTKYLAAFWDKIVQPIFRKFYLAKEAGPYANHLGCEVLHTLFRVSMPHPEKEFNEARILFNDPINLPQINPLPSRFVLIKFDKMMQNMISLFELDTIKFEQKLGLLKSFLNKIKLVVKKEQSPSVTTYDLIDNLPLLLRKLLGTQAVSSEVLVRVIVVMHDVFSPSLLINCDLGSENYDNNLNVYLPIVESSSALPLEGRMTVIRLILQSLLQTKALILITDILELPTTTNDTIQIIIELLSKTNIVANTIDLQLYAMICKCISCNYEVFVKKMIQAIVSIPNSEEICRCLTLLHIDEWKSNVADHVLLLLRNAPSKSIHHFVAGIISRRLEASLVQSLAFMTKNDFSSEMFLLSGNLFDLIVKDKASLFECCVLLKQYLKFKCQQGGNDYLLIDVLAAGCSKHLDIDITFLEKLVDFSHLPLSSREVQLQKAKSSTEVLLETTSLDSQDEHSRGDIDMIDNDSMDQSSLGLITSLSQEVAGDIRSEDAVNLDRNTLKMIVKTNNSLREGRSRSSMAIENLIGKEEEVITSKQCQSESRILPHLRFPEKLSNVANNANGQIHSATSNTQGVSNYDTSEERRYSQVDESVQTPLLSAIELVKLLAEKSSQELNMFSPQQKYELESELLRFMIKLRQLE